MRDRPPLPDGGRTWDRGWDGHARAQMRRLARLPLPAKIQWLEQTHRLVLHLRAQRPPPRAS